MSSPSPFQAADRIAGRYELLALVGAGPLGEVWKAIDRELDFEVALKFLNPRPFEQQDDREQLSRQLRTSRKLFHPHLARITDEGEEKGWPFYVTSFVRGQSLRTVMDARRATSKVFSFAEVEGLIGQIAGALSAAHRGGVFSNVKPQNVIVGHDVLVVRDLGLAMALPRQAYMEAEARGGLMPYAAPEFTRGAKPEASSDIYALGVLTGELISFAVPDGTSRPELSKNRADLPRAIEELYRRVLSEDPKARSSSPLVFFEELSDGFRAGPKQKPALANTTTMRATGASADPTLLVSAASLPFTQTTGSGSRERSASLLERAAVLVGASAAPPPRAEPLRQSSGPPARPPPLGKRPAPPPDDLTQPLQSVDSQSTRPVEAVSGRLGTGILPQVQQGAWGAATSTPTPHSQRLSAVLKALPREIESNPWLRLALIVAFGVIVGTGAGLWATDRLRHRMGKPSRATFLMMNGTRGTELSFCPEGMKYVPEGPFQMGAPAGDPLKEFDDWSASAVTVRAFCVDEFEYPNRMGERPKVRASWTDAQWLCALQHKRLCTEAEWEKACKGPENLRFPYAKDYASATCRTDRPDAPGPEPSGSASECRSGYGVMDLSGNLAEWTQDAIAHGRALKGGAYDSGEKGARCSARLLVPADTHSPSVGFRCCKRPGNEEKEGS